MMAAPLAERNQIWRTRPPAVSYSMTEVSGPRRHRRLVDPALGRPVERMAMVMR